MKIYHVTAFYKEAYGGNKAGVVLFADVLTDTEKQQIATRLGYSETAFVSHCDEADFDLRFFTPTSEVDLCGHATIGAFNVLRDEGFIKPGIYTQKTKAGLLKLDVKEDHVFMQQLKPRFYQEIEQSYIDDIFLSQVDILEGYPIEVVSTGLKEIFLPVSSEESLKKLLPNFEMMIRFCDSIGAIGVHAFYLGSGEIDAVSRNFAPVVGIDEESATGTSNGALGCYLYKHGKKKLSYHMEQGLSMNQPSEIFVNLLDADCEITEVWVGGKALILKIEE